MPERQLKPTPVSKSRSVAGAAPFSSSDIFVNLKRKADYAWPLQKLARQFPGHKKTPMPTGLKPALASLKEEAFNNPAWQFEIKWDGYRTLAYHNGNDTDLRSRNNLSLNQKFAAVVTAFQDWPVRAVLDGEVVVLSPDGKADFGALQNYDEKAGANLKYFVFDLLWIEGIDLRQEPLAVRRTILKELLPEGGLLRFSESVDECGVDFLAAAKQTGLEGIIAKRKESVYSDGVRTNDWYKIKLECRHEAVICGYTKLRGSSRLFSSLALGIPTANGLRYIGQVGTGFTGGSQRDLFKKMNPLFTADCPFDQKPATGGPTQWVKPKLVCEVKYTALTADGYMRHPSFQGLREDKGIREINLNEACAGDRPKSQSTPRSNGNNSSAEIEDTTVITSDKHSLKLSHLTKRYWPKEGFTKGDVIAYYRGIAPYILPYLKDRPQSLHRFPNGIEGQSFYQKDSKGNLPPWVKTFKRVSESDGETKACLVCTDEASLLYMVNLGCIEMNPWHSRIASPLRPDWCVIDLDPGAVSFANVVETAKVVKEVLDHLKIPSFPKTSGATGMHIYIPLGAQYTYEQSRHLAELICSLVHQALPRLTSLERNPAKRKTKIYLDCLQNREIQTICSPYSLRPRASATVSAPLHWDEVKKGLTPLQFTMQNMMERLGVEGDLFKGVLGKGINLSAVLKMINPPKTK